MWQKFSIISMFHILILAWNLCATVSISKSFAVDKTSYAQISITYGTLLKNKCTLNKCKLLKKNSCSIQISDHMKNFYNITAQWEFIHK